MTLSGQEEENKKRGTGFYGKMYSRQTLLDLIEKAWPDGNATDSCVRLVEPGKPYVDMMYTCTCC